MNSMTAPFDVTDIRIETERLILRPWRETDLEDFYQYASVDGVGQMAGWLPHKSIQESKVVLDIFCKGRNVFALEYKQSGHVIGSLSLDEQEEGIDFPANTRGRELGFALSKAYWGQGLMPEAVKAVIDYCFSVLNFDWLSCGHFVENGQSQKVIEKCEFVFVTDMIFDTRAGTKEPGKYYIQFNPDK